MTDIEIVTGGGRHAPGVVRAAEHLLLLEDIEEEQPTWLDLNRTFTSQITDSHLKLGMATITDVLDKLSPTLTINDVWLRWRRAALESIVNPTQVHLLSAPFHSPVIVPVEPPGKPNTEAMRRAYSDAAWLATNRGKWVVVYGGKIYDASFSAHEDALGFAMDRHGMLGDYLCPYVSDIYCDYKMKIYERMSDFAEDIRDL